MSGREKNDFAAKLWFYSTTCGQRPKHGRKFFPHTKLKPYLELKKNAGKKTQHVFGGPGRKVFWGVFIIFRLRMPIPPVPYNEKICNSQNMLTLTFYKILPIFE